MRIVLIGIGLLCLVIVSYWGIRFLYLLHVSKGLVASAVPYSIDSKDTSVSILVLGDSTAAGVGAGSPELSVPGRVASYVHATYVENHAVSGATVADIPAQYAQAKLHQYSLILIQIGGNDIVRFHNAEKTANEFNAFDSSAEPYSNNTIVISAGDVGSSRLFPLPLRIVYSHLNKEYHTAFHDALSSPVITYVNLALAPGNELFTTDPKTYFAADEFHPSAAGYGIWFDALKPTLQDLDVR